MRVAVAVETATRELDSKIFLSLELVNQGHEVYLGKGVGVGIDLINPDIYISKCNHSDKKIHDENGVTKMLLDAEGGFFTSANKYSKRIFPEYLNGFDYYLAWGKRSADIAEKNADDTEIIITGNPRFDLLQEPLKQIYDNKINDITEELGNFVLVNTNFVMANHINNPSPPQNSLGIDEDIHEYYKNLYLEFIDMIKKLSDEININIVVRPHPSENIGSYEKRFDEYENIWVLQEGDVEKWISACHLLVHNRSTTGIEAALMGKKVYSYDPVSNGTNDLVEVPNKISISETNQRHLINKIKEDIQTSNFDYNLEPEQYRLLKETIDNLDYCSTKKIVKLINSIDEIDRAESGKNYSPTNKEKIKRILLTIDPRSLTYIRNLGLKQKWSESNQQFPFINDSEIESKINQYSTWIDTSEIHFERVKKLENTFRIYT